MPRTPNLRSRIDAWRDRPRFQDPRSAGTPKLSFALLLMALVMAGGTLGFVETEEWEPWRAFYFTLTTVTTVGYGDEGISEDGKKFASLLLMGGVLSASYAFSMIVQTSVARQLAWKKRMQKRISRLHGHTIVCGFGRMGQSVCKKLATRGTHFVVIDQDPLHVSRALDLGYLVIEGNACEAESLIHAGITRAGHIVAAVDNVAENIVITMESRELAPKAYIIARAERDEDVRKLERAGVNRVLCPFKSGGREVVDFVTRPKVADFLARASMSSSGIALAEIRIGPESALVGRELRELGTREADRLSFVALEATGAEIRIPPRGTDVLGVNDLLIVAGDPDQVAKLSELARPSGLHAA